MCKNNDAHNIWSLLTLIPKTIKSELTTPFGKVNLVSDLILAGVVAAIFTVDTVENIAITFASIWNKDIMQYLSSADSLIALIILIGFFIVCLIFSYLSEKLIKKNE